MLYKSDNQSFVTIAAEGYQSNDFDQSIKKNDKILSGYFRG
jgi:hypothetical protein